MLIFLLSAIPAYGDCITVFFFFFFYTSSIPTFILSLHIFPYYHFDFCALIFRIYISSVLFILHSLRFSSHFHSHCAFKIPPFDTY